MVEISDLGRHARIDFDCLAARAIMGFIDDAIRIDGLEAVGPSVLELHKALWKYLTSLGDDDFLARLDYKADDHAD
jgi:hypothetical protein